MRTAIKLEMFGMGDPKRAKKYMGWNTIEPSVARIEAFDEQTGDFQRVYLHGYLDYAEANGVGTRGIYKYWFVGDGLFEIHERTAWRRSRNYFLLVQDGHKQEIDIEAALAWLDQITSTSSAKTS